ncbi:ubiquitin conjugating enzyme [Coprinopsis cinerea okayama7|uniref:Ubiquitin conjugating enzyme n=1 Tax=Coprinopsis cinerea (strain Okayama-7 / 130 / ATCC MYA-4618 / FGSC 9003) TaxID=240176 RepID=A8NJT2_COPC7|nr:ubiquitin conjugating enzyme [Coprinopsis cinerea okayama7\|eukprot:XP_001834287.2 ubiquitin conjugating enzyme [Coprinopsis cinerea okayama7\
MASRNANTSTAVRRLMTEYKQLTSGGPISESDFFTWEALICGPKDTPFFLVAIIRHVQEANYGPRNRLCSVYPDGNVCISILHTPGDDPTHYEQASERWSPVQSVEKVILSVISMLAGTRRLPGQIFEHHALNTV